MDRYFGQVDDDDIRNSGMTEMLSNFHQSRTCTASFQVPDNLSALECIDDNVYAARLGSILVFDTLVLIMKTNSHRM